METSSPQEVVNLLRTNMLRTRTGLWLLPSTLLGKERNEAARLMVDVIDIREVLLDHIPPTSRFSGLNDQRLLELLDEISEQQGFHNCALIYNLDLLLARLSYSEIKNVWEYVINFMPHRTRALLLTMPDTANALLPSEEEKQLLGRENRLAVTKTIRREHNDDNSKSCDR